jgi:tetratricopeptide (TPR) repeat protein
LNGVPIRKRKERRLMERKMGQTAEDIRDNIVKIADENGNCVGTGFFIHKEYCVTCHHNISGLNEIYVEREGDNIGEGQQKKRRYSAEWVEEFSDMQKDVAFLKVKAADFKPLEYRRETYGNIPVIVRGFPLQELYNFPEGKDERGTLRHIRERFRWREEEIIVEVQDKWNIKPEVNVQVYAFNGKFSAGFSGAPVCYEHDWIVVGMFEAKDDNQGYIIPMNIVIGKFDLDQKTKKVSAPSPSLNAQKILDMGNEHYYKREYAKAIEQYEIVIKDPNYANACFNKGSALSHLGKYEEAIKCFDKVIELYPKIPDVWYNKCTSLLYLGKHEEAIKCFDKVIELKPDYANAWSNKGSALSNLGKYEEAIACHDKALKTEPNDVGALTNKGIALDLLGKHEEAIKYLDKTLDIDPNFVEALNSKGGALSNLGKHEEAIKYLDKTLDIDPNHAGAWYNKGIVLIHLGKHEEAIKCFDKTLDIDPNIPLAWNNKGFAWNNKGFALSRLGKYQEAIVCYDKALEIEPDNSLALNNKGSALGNLGRYEEAIVYYDKVIRLNPNNADAWSDKGMYLDDLGRYEEAIMCHNKAIELNPNDGRYWYNRACTEALKGDTENGLADLKRSIELNKRQIELAKQDKDFENIRSDERFKDLIR